MIDQDGKPVDKTSRKSVDLVDIEALRIAAERAQRLSDELKDGNSYDHSPQGDWPIRNLFADINASQRTEQIFTGLNSRAYLIMVCRILLRDTDLVLSAPPLDLYARESMERLRYAGYNVKPMKSDLADSMSFEREIQETKPAVVYMDDLVKYCCSSPERMAELAAILGRAGSWIIEDTSHRLLNSVQSTQASFSQLTASDRFVQLGGYLELYHPMLQSGFLMIRNESLQQRLSHFIQLHLLFPSIFPQRVSYFYILNSMNSNDIL